MQKSSGYQLDSDELHFRQGQLKGKVISPTVIAVGISDPANIGSIYRICDAINCEKIIFVDTPILNPKKITKVSRSVSGKIPAEYIPLPEFLKRRNELSPLIAIEITSTSTDLYETALPDKCSFVIGNERDGIPQSILDICTFAVHITMFGINSSMNVATSLGVVMYEWYRSRKVNL